MNQLKKILDSYYRDFNFEERTGFDPVEIPHRYKTPHDREVAGFIASCFAYGRVELFKPVVEKIVSVMGTSPYDFLMNLAVKRQRKLFSGIKYRFNENEDIICLVFILQKVYAHYESLENAFKRFYRADDTNIEKGLSGLMSSFLKTDTLCVYGKNVKPAGLMHFFPSPSKNSTCKRANLFLRWMIRDKDVDLGLWKDIPKNKLVIPLDTHIARISRCLGFTKRSTPNWKVAVEITESLMKLDPEDPLKYDFALCHHGISGLCRGIREVEVCSRCVFKMH